MRRRAGRAGADGGPRPSRLPRAVDGHGAAPRAAHHRAARGARRTAPRVLGGGIAGAAAAYHLARLGRRVTLVERGEVAGEASGVNAGSIDATGWGRAPDLHVHLTTGSLEIFQALQLD